MSADAGGPEPWEEQLLRAGPLTSQQLSLFLDKLGISRDVQQNFCRELRFAPEEIIRCLSSISTPSGSPLRATRAARDAVIRGPEELRQMLGHLRRSVAAATQELAEAEGATQKEGSDTSALPVDESPKPEPSQSSQQQVQARADIQGPSVARPAGMASGEEVTDFMKDRQKEKPEQWSMTVRQWVDTVAVCMASREYELVKEQSREGTVNMHDINRLFVKPWSEGTGCSLAVLMSRDVACNAQLMISHCWGEDVSETKESLQQHVARCELPETVPLWFCVFSNYQPEDGAGPTLEHQLALEPFSSVIENQSLKSAAGGHGMVALHTTSADLYSRLWCVHEVDRAIEADVAVTASMSQKYTDLMTGRVQEFMDMGASAEDCFRAAGVEVQCVKACCGSKDDEKKLVKLILQQKGGFNGLDRVVQNFRREQLPDIIFETLIGKGLTKLDGASKSARANAAVVLAACQAHGAGQLQHATTNQEVSECIRLAGFLGDHEGQPYDVELKWEVKELDLEDLTLGHVCHIRAGDAAQLEQLRQHTTLSLDFRDKNLGDKGAKAVSQAIAQLKELTTLTLGLYDNELGAEGAKAVCEAIAQLKKVTTLTLDLRHNRLGRKGQDAVREAIEQLKITNLRLHV
ncbi:unnamed protein product [Polarella glacialis]|uniref:Protein NLRC3 n=1 Tax=Polarella glacialis TaxID=89957 RepID=A0A813ELG2_POLGL|nr:unnamed protein product [Polarella glacialis]